jgi:hypothetical protein
MTPSIGAVDWNGCRWPTGSTIDDDTDGPWLPCELVFFVSPQAGLALGRYKKIEEGRGTFLVDLPSKLPRQKI